jgi:Holliday junction resolvasome RuvABC ATP-dependent DNA helicase subunit
LADLPTEVDAAWFARHAASFRWNDRHGEMQYEAGVASRSPSVRCPHARRRKTRPDGNSACAQLRTSPTPLAEGGPSALDEIVGQRETKRLLHTAVLAANRRGAALDHALFFGPPGVGKSTVARLLAIDLGVRAKVVNAPTLSEPGVLLRLLTGLRARDVLFIDEIHALPQRLVETLYEAMEERRASFAVGDGRRSRTLSVKLEPFTLVGATTEAGRLPAPFESRFGLQAFFAPYECDDLREILLRAAAREGLRLRRRARRRRSRPRRAGRPVRRWRFSVGHAIVRSCAHPATKRRGSIEARPRRRSRR